MQGWNSMQVQFAAPLQQYKITKYNTVLEKNAAKDIVQNSTVYSTKLHLLYCSLNQPNFFNFVRGRRNVYNRKCVRNQTTRFLWIRDVLS
jgi:hypothetical protein